MNTTAFQDFAHTADGPNSRILIVAAHPDDETIGAGGRLAVLRDVSILHVTDGAPRNMVDASAAGFETREAYARARRGELAEALALMGKSTSCTRELGIVDQEASLDLEGLALLLAKEIESLRPDLVLTHPYEGGHPDHDAAAFAVHAARELLARDKGRVPEIAEFTSYHNKNGGMSYFEFLPNDERQIETMFLSESERDLKRRMIQAFRTQQATIAQFPVDLERFRIAPSYDFAAPPHEGTLLYERYGWGMRSERWRELTAKTCENLRIKSKI